MADVTQLVLDRLVGDGILMVRPTLHHFVYRPTMHGMDDHDDADFFAWRSRQRVVIGHDTWIGHGVVGLGPRHIDVAPA